MRRSLIAIGMPIALVAGLVATSAPAKVPSAAASSANTTISASERRVTVDVKVDRFTVEGRRVVARGAAAARVLTRDGVVRRQSTPVQLDVAAGSSCRVLYLRLDDLQVKLLGLNLNTSTITVRIKGDNKRVLGKLFCQLAESIRLEQVKSALPIARSLNRRLDGRPMRVLGFRAALYAQDAQAAQAPPAAQAPQAAPQCQLLDLTIGPLNLDLLGLVVDVYGADRTQPVRVVATADPNGGVLGRTLCKLANGEAVP